MKKIQQQKYNEIQQNTTKYNVQNTTGNTAKIQQNTTKCNEIQRQIACEESYKCIQK